MALRKVWGFNPNSGGMKIPDNVKQDVVKRINRIAEKRYKGKYTRLDIYFRNQFCYIDAYQEPWVGNRRFPKGEETRKEFIERLRSTPTHLCRLRYSLWEWGFAFYAYSHEKYELCVYPNGKWFGKPEDAFIASAVYLND